jgi:hypothetical protein
MRRLVLACSNESMPQMKSDYSRSAMLSDNLNLLGRRGTSPVLPADVVFVVGTRNEEAFCLEEVPGRT